MERGAEKKAPLLGCLRRKPAPGTLTWVADNIPLNPGNPRVVPQPAQPEPRIEWVRIEEAARVLRREEAVRELIQDQRP